MVAICEGSSSVFAVPSLHLPFLLAAAFPKLYGIMVHTASWQLQELNPLSHSEWFAFCVTLFMLVFSVSIVASHFS